MVATATETGRGYDKQIFSTGYVICGKQYNERPIVEVFSLLGVGTVLRLERDAW